MFDAIIEAVFNKLWEMFDAPINGIAGGATSIFDWMMGIVYNIITADWGTLDGNNVANLIYKINKEGLVPIGIAAVTVFTMANIFKSSTSLLQFKRPSIFIPVFLKLILADATVTLSYPLFRWFFNLFAQIIRSLYETTGYADSTGFTGLITSSTNTFTKGDGGAWLIALILVIVLFVAMLVTAFSVLLTVMGRFFKIYLYAMVSPLPLATLSCEGIDRIGKSYLMSFAGICLEGVVIAGAGVVFATYLRSGDFLKANNGSGVLEQAFSFLSPSGAQVVANQIGMLLNMSIFSGMVKGSDRIVREMMS